MLNKLFKNLGPGTFIAAAFIGPGTITLCTIAGIKFDMALLWTMFIAILSSMILQSMSLKIGIVGRKNIIQAIRHKIKITWIRNSINTLIFIAIFVGNTAYEAGNISGAVLGLESLFGDLRLIPNLGAINIYSIIIGGALGNLYDRLNYFAVPDFIDFHIQTFHWFTFNLADIFITLGIIIMLFKEINSKKKNN